MTDGQSEGARMSEVAHWQSSTGTIADLIYRVSVLERQLAAIQPDDTEEMAEEIARDNERLEQFANRVILGIPLSMTEQREVLSIALGRPIEPRKRCKLCHGDGRVLSANTSVAMGSRVYHPCNQCEGSGYVA